MHRRFLISRFFIVCIGFVLSEIQIVAAESFPQVRFTPLPSDILPSNEVRKLYQDSDGYIWIPTYNGLARYDGYGAITYGMRDVSNGLFNTFVNVVVEDHDKNLWIGTEHGLFRLDKVSGNIVADEYPELADCNIAVILCDTGNGIWIGGDKGLFRKNALDRNFHPVPISNSAGRPVKAVTSIIKDDKLNLWIAAFDQGLLRYDIREDRAYACDDAVLRKAHVLARDVAGNIWVGTWGAGVVRLVNPLAPGPTRYVHYKHVPGRTHSLLDDIIYDIEENPEQNTIWIGGRSGLSILHDIDNPDSFQNFFPGDNVGDLPYNEVNSILRTRDGLMWIGLLGGGVCKVQTSGTKFESDRLEPIRTRYNTSSVRSMYYAGNGDFWFGLLDFGLIKYNIRSGKIVDYHEHPDLKSLPYTSTVNTIIRRSTTGELYFGTQNAGIWVYNETQHKVRQINHFNQPNFLDDCVIALCEDTHGNLWIGSRLGIYVESTDGRFHTAAEWLGYATPFDQTYVFDICCDKAGDVWIASNGQGILHIRTADGTWRQYTRDNGMISDHVYCLQADDTGCIWAGTFADGLAVRIPSEGSFKAVSAFPNLENKGIGNIARDENGRMWITTNNSVFSFSPDSLGNPEHINTYIISADMQSFFFNRNASAQVDYGRIAFGGSNGLMIFTGNRTQPHQTRLPIVLTDFKVHNRSLRTIPARERSRISLRDIDYTDAVTLTHDRNSFFIEFSMLSYANPRDHIFRYRLDGFDKEYVTADSHHRFASYSNLSPGTYTFRLQAAGENGVWSSNERTLTVRILPAPWLSWWAWTIYSVLLLVLAYGVVRFLRYRLRLRQEVQISKLERQKTEELNHAKLQFFTNITHELLTPLTIISATVDELKMRFPGHDDLYTVMGSNISRLIRLLQQILEFRKAETGNLKLRVSPGDVAAFVKNEAESFLPLVKKRKIHFSVLCNPESIIGYFDTDKLDKILYNLLSNAAKYNKEGGYIQVTLMYAEDRDFVRLHVKDNGSGISKDKQKSLFKRFYEGDYRKFNTIGTGIGLSLVKDLVELHGGSIEVESEEGRGTEFIVTLPVDRSYFKEEQIDEEAVLPVQKTVTYLEEENAENVVAEKPKAHTILVVEDNEELLQLMVRLLKREYNVHTAENGQEAVTVLDNEDIDLIVSDVMMPVMDGIEFCRYVKNKLELSHIPVILLTAKNKEEDRAEAYEVGADAFISKPFNLAVLHARIRNLLKYKERKAHDFKNQLVFEIKELDYTSIDEDFMQRAIDCVNRHLEDSDFDQPQFVEEMGTSKSTLYKKLKSLTGLNTSAFIRNIRLKAACRIMEEKGSSVRVSDLAYAVGFNDPKYFSSCFKKEFGMLPTEYQERFIQS